MSSLQLRITFAILLAVVVVAALVGTATYQRLEEQSQADFNNTVQAVREAVTSRLERDAGSLNERVDALRKHQVIRRLSQDLQEGAWDTRVTIRRRTKQDLKQLMVGASLDALWVLDAQDSNRVIGAPHRLGDVGLPAEIAAYVLRGMESFVIARESLVRHGRPIELVTVESGVRAGRLILVGGRVVGTRVASDLQAGIPSKPHIEVRDGGGELLAETPVLSDYSTTQTAEVVHHNPGAAEPALVVALQVSREQLDAQLRDLSWTLLYITSVGGILGLLLGRLLATRITAKLQVLVSAARSIGAGDRDVQLPAADEDEVGELVHAFDRMRHELDENDARLRRAERVAAWQDIARELAHEIKNPLTPIQMAMETLRRAHQRRHERFDELFTESTETILEEVARLSKIVSEFSQFARMPSPQPRAYSLNDVVHSVAVLYRDGHIELSESLGDDVGDIRIDPERMTQVIQNLVLNAVQATAGVERKGRIRLVTERIAPDRVQLLVSDNGPGISDADMPRVFTPYFTAKAGGTGLGLAIAHRIVDGHGGRIGVRSTPGEGTTFLIQLPG